VEAGFFPGVVFYFTFWYTSKYRAKMIALFMSAIPLSGIFAGPLAGSILKHLQGAAGLTGWQWLFLIYGIPLSIAGVVALFVMTNDPERAAWLTADEKKLVLDGLQAEHEADKRRGGAKSRLVDAFANGSVWLLCLVYFGISAANYGIGFYMPQVIKDSISSDPVAIGWLYAIPWVVTAVVMLLVGRHSDQTGERRWHLALCCFGAALGFVISALPGIPGVVSLAGLTLATASVLSAFTMFWAVPTALLAGTAAAAGIAWINAVGNLGGYAAPHAIGIIVDRTHSMTLAMLTMAGAMLVAALVTLYVTRKGALRR
jgi:nitrate/nitrite transporter NarK